ncbi:MAG: L-seryl-tRNA(Sec) selenium transferase [Dehalococcoidia bacterium]|nr:MAG: L-seryl-tRNA(Sec) selenium transferase [Dehalococcoidia bacterium]
MSSAVNNKELRKLPSIEKILEAPEIQPEIDRYSRNLVTQAAQTVIKKARRQIVEGFACPTVEKLFEEIKFFLIKEWPGFLNPVINATGIIIHTNLGRAPLSGSVLEAVSKVSGNFSNLEYDLLAGKRGSRAKEVEKLLCQLTGSESALVVNNNAAAVLLVLIVLARNKEVIVSRGELVQIGGGFRVPDIMEQSGVRLVEVGTTNQTYIKDYEQAIDTKSALLLKVHQSNFIIKGFTHSVEIRELKALGQKHNLPVVYDLGSGAMLNTEDYIEAHEPTVQEALVDGSDIVCFSGDKLLGGPQSGIILGDKPSIDKMRKHPLMRVIRIDKMTATALAATLKHYLQKEAVEKIPVWQMIAANLEEIESRAQFVVKKLGAAGIKASVINGKSMVGGGSLPDQSLPTRLVAIKPQYSLEDFTHQLRLATPPLLGRVEGEQYLIDMRTVVPTMDADLVEVITSTFAKAEQ